MLPSLPFALLNAWVLDVPDFSGVQEASERETEREAEGIKGSAAGAKRDEVSWSGCIRKPSPSAPSTCPSTFQSATTEPGHEDHLCLLSSSQAHAPAEASADSYFLNRPVVSVVRETYVCSQGIII